MARISKVLAAGLAMSAMAAMTPPPAAFEVSPGVRVTAPAQPDSRALTVNAAREETERVRELDALPPRRHRHRYDGQHRTAGDRAHKRWKRARASGRH